MFIYILLIFLLLLFYPLAHEKNSSFKKHIGKLIVIVLTIILVLRAESVGTDTMSTIYLYMSALSQEIENNTLSFKAPIYYLYSYILYNIFPYRHAIVFSNGIFTMLCFTYFIYKCSDDIYLSFYLFITLGFYFQCFNGMRQMLALSIFVVAFSQIYMRRIKRGVLLASIACGIHVTVIIALPLLAIFRLKRISNMFICMCIYILSLSVLFHNTIIAWVAYIINDFLPSYSGYVVGQSLTFGYTGQGRIVWLYLFYMLFILFTCYLNGKSKNHILEEKTKLFIIPILVGVSIGCWGITNPLFSRLSVYYLIFIIILIPAVLRYFNPVSRCILSTCIFILMLLPYFISLVSNHSHVVPYRLFL